MTDVARFHEEMDTLDGPMVVVTAGDGTQRGGCLVGFHTQVSVEPPRYLVCLSIENHTYGLARRASHLGVHFLAEGQRDLAQRFGGRCGREIDKFADLEVREGPGGTALLVACAHWFVGKVLATLDLGDHVAFALEPIMSGGADERGPLLGYQAVKDLDPGHQP